MKLLNISRSSTLAGLVCCALLAPAVPAQPFPAGEADQAPEVGPRPVRLRSLPPTKVGRGCLVTLPTEVERVALADDTIARAQIPTSQEVLLTGLAPGETTVYVWLTDGRRLRYLFRVVRNLDLLRRTLEELDPRIAVETSEDGRVVVLRGEVSGRVAREALSRARVLLGDDGAAGTRILNLLRYPGSSLSPEDRLADLMLEIDPRIRVRVIRVGPNPEPDKDTYVLEGRVRDVGTLMRTVILAERQLGGSGDRVAAISDDRVLQTRNRGFRGSFGDSSSFENGRGGSSNGVAGLEGRDPRSSSLATQIARDLVITSESGRVVSLLEVDDLPQIAVSIRVLEVDRAKAKRVGVNFRIDNEHVSIGNYVSPQIDTLPPAGSPPAVDALAATGNLVAAFVDQTTAIVTAIDFLQDKDLARAVAEPNILTLSGETASVLVGGEIPIETNTVGQIAVVQGFFFQEFGVRLDIRPTVDRNGMIALEVAPSIVRPSPGLGVGGVPGFQIQSVQTTARVAAGKSLVIGGLLSFEEGLEERRMPGLGAIPLFRWKRRSRQEQELLFVITPRLVVVEDQPEPAVEQPEDGSLILPELEWPEERRRWRDELEPEPLRPDGVPPEFLKEDVPVRYAEPEPIMPAEEELEPTPRPEAEVAFDPVAALPPILVVAADPCLNLRPEPGTWSAPTDCLPPGTRVEVLDDDGPWSRVRLDDGREGWMAPNHLVPGATSDLEALILEREAVNDQLDAAESADQELEQQLREIREAMDRLRRETGVEDP